MIIYKATNKLNGLSYIGQTNDFNKRKCEHRHAASKHREARLAYFHHALGKHGWNNFEWTILEECRDRAHANERETFYIQLLNTIRPNGYNLESGREVHEIHESTRAKLRELNLGDKNPMHGKPAWNRGAKASEETKAKLSSTRIAIQQEPGWIHPTKGLIKTEDQRKKSAPKNPAHGESWQAAHKGQFTSEVRAKMSLAKSKGKVFCETNGVTYDSAGHAQKELKISNVQKVCDGIIAQTKGFKFRYLK